MWDSNDNALVIPYLKLRRFIGYLGLTLPFLLWWGNYVICREGIEDSISDYYYTTMGDVFVGVMCAIGCFLLTYRGHDPIDNIFGNVAFVAACCVAIFPTTSDAGATGMELAAGVIHYVAALTFFVMLICFSLILFTKSKTNATPTPQKVKRNRVYKVCGWTMFACILLIGAWAITKWYAPEGTLVSLIKPVKPVYWLETIAVVAFGISWLTKGERILADK